MPSSCFVRDRSDKLRHAALPCSSRAIAPAAGFNAVPRSLSSAAAIFLLLPCPDALRAQGDLTPPPGPPGPTMKTLDQIEARIIVNDTNTPGDASNTFIISAPGSYYLTGNLVGESGKHGISIQSNDVTLDLNGFALLGDGGAGGATRGIDTSAAAAPFTNVSVRNGSARGWTGSGVWLGSATALAERLRVANCTGASRLPVATARWCRTVSQAATASASSARIAQRSPTASPP